MKRNLFLAFLSILVVLSGFSQVMASQHSNFDTGINTAAQEEHNQKVMLEKEKVLDLLSKLGESQAKAELDKTKVNRVIYSKGLEESYVKNLEKQLFDLGVTTLTENEIATIQARNITPYVTLPPTTKSVKWYSYKATVNNGGQKYEVQELYAQGLNSNSNLSNGRNGATLYSNQQIAVNNLSTLASIYAQKAIGNVPIVNWTPYELLFSSNSGVTNNSHVITYRSLSTVCFSYVKKSGQSDNYQDLRHVSNMVSIASTNTLAGYRSGKPYTQSKDQTNTSYATNYANFSKAVEAHKNNSIHRSYISNYTFYNHNRTKSVTQSILKPSFPANIY